MTAYTTRPPRQRRASRWDYDELFRPSLTVFDPGDTSHPTGILDAQGNELYRVEQTGRVGFLTDKTR